MNENRLSKENCNKSHCKSCIFHPDESKRINLRKERIIEIQTYLSRFNKSHICHQTNKTCFGALEFQANILFRMGLIEENTVESFLNEAQKILNL